MPDLQDSYHERPLSSSSTDYFAVDPISTYISFSQLVLVSSPPIDKTASRTIAMSSLLPPTSPHPSLTGIPSEVRRVILDQCFVGAEMCRRDSQHTQSDHYAVLLGCKQIYEEGIDLYYKQLKLALNKGELEFCSLWQTQLEMVQQVEYLDLFPRTEGDRKAVLRILDYFESLRMVYLYADNDITIPGLKQDLPDDSILSVMQRQCSVLKFAQLLVMCKPELTVIIRVMCWCWSMTLVSLLRIPALQSNRIC